MDMKYNNKYKKCKKTNINKNKNIGLLRYGNYEETARSKQYKNSKTTIETKYEVQQ